MVNGGACLRRNFSTSLYAKARAAKEPLGRLSKLTANDGKKFGE